MKRISQLQRANLRVQSAQRLYENAMSNLKVGDDVAFGRLWKASYLLQVARERYLNATSDSDY